MISDTNSVSEKSNKNTKGNTAMNNDPDAKTNKGFNPIAFSWVSDKLLITAIIAKGIK